MSKVHDGWIPCTKYNKPPEGFGYDLSTSDEVDRHTLDIPWSDREVRGDYWRPAKCDGWILNDGTEPEGRVDVVLQGGNVIPAWDSEAWDSEAMDWGVFADGLSILWWRPAKAMVEEEQKPESARDGWIPCTKGNKPPEGFRFALKVRGLTYVDSEEIDPWADRVKRGDYWRPAADDGWQLNDGTKQTGQVEAVLRYGRVILDCDAVDLGWNVFDDTHSILWWRPAASAVTEESDSSLLGSLISAWDDYKGTVDRWRAANEVIRDKMGERDRVVMRHDGDLYLVEWDDAETVSWVQIDEI